jgi:guanylate kinase
MNKIDMTKAKPRLVVLAGPTAVGKGTVVRELLSRFPEVWLSVSVTTRAARPGEIDGVHYWFISTEQFEQMRDAGELLEWAQVHGKHYYGSPRQPVVEHLAAGKATLLEIDLAGARQVKETMPDALFVFLAPPSYEELVNRLVGRGTENEAERTRRLETAQVELAAASEFDSIIVNDTVDNAASELAFLMKIG